MDYDVTSYQVSFGDLCADPIELVPPPIVRVPAAIGATDGLSPQELYGPWECYCATVMAQTLAHDITDRTGLALWDVWDTLCRVEGDGVAMLSNPWGVAFVGSKVVERLTGSEAGCAFLPTLH